MMNHFKKNILLIGCILFAFTVRSQKIDIYPNEVRGLEKTFVLNGILGKSTATTNLWLTNHTRQTLRIFARPHLEGDALYFIDKAGTTSVEFSLEIRPGTSGNLYMFGYLDKGNARSCNGYLALAATPLMDDGSKGNTRTLKLPVCVNIKEDNAQSAAKTASNQQTGRNNNASNQRPSTETIKSGKPDRYEYVTYQGMPMHWHLRQLPLRIYSDDKRTGDTAVQYASVVRRVVDIWNGVGRESVLKKDFFKIVQQPNQADIRLDWTGKHLLPGAQGTAYPSDAMVGMMPLDRFYNLGRAGETLLQELGHMLGMGHSEIPEDIMFHRARNFSPELARLSVTQRDKQMLIWLYSQKQYTSFKD